MNLLQPWALLQSDLSNPEPLQSSLDNSKDLDIAELSVESWGSSRIKRGFQEALKRYSFPKKKKGLKTSTIKTHCSSSQRRNFSAPQPISLHSMAKLTWLKILLCNHLLTAIRNHNKIFNNQYLKTKPQKIIKLLKSFLKINQVWTKKRKPVKSRGIKS